MIKRYADEAPLGAARRADELLAAGDVQGCAVWKRILLAMTELQKNAPGEQDSVR